MADIISEKKPRGRPLKAGPTCAVCLYPIVNHPGWEDERHCHNGLWDYCNENDDREIYEPLAREIKHFVGSSGLTVNKVFGKAA